MKPNDKDFALFIDGIRIERGLSRLDLIDDIVSLSQYKRYLRGVTAIPNDIVIQLADKLKYNITDFYTMYTRKHSNEYNQINHIYTLMKKNRFQEALEECDKINYDLIVSSFNKMFYDFCYVYSQHKLGQISNVHILGIYSDLIDYPNCLNNESFNMIEINILTQIVLISSVMGNYEPAKQFYEKLNSDNFESYYTGDGSILPVVYYTTSRVFFHQKAFDETLNLCEKGIGYSLHFETLKSLPHLLLMKAIAQKKLGLEKESIATVKKCFLQLKIINQEGMIDVFLNSYHKHFDTPVDELLSDISDIL